MGSRICAESLSGLYDLAPLATSFLQPEVQFTDQEIASWSPVLGRPSPGIAVTLIAGGAETAPLHEQMAAYAGVLRSAGARVAVAAPAGEDHMTIVRSLGEAGTNLRGSCARRSKPLAACSPRRDARLGLRAPSPGRRREGARRAAYLPPQRCG